MKNINFSLFFKINLALSIAIFLLFLQYNESYSSISFSLTLLGAISSTMILYALLYILLFIFIFTDKFILYLSSIIFFSVNVMLIVDFFIFRLYKFHINSMVLNILTSPSAMDSIQIGNRSIIIFALIIISLILFEIYIIKKLFSMQDKRKKALNKKINKNFIKPIIFIILSEKILYGVSSLLSKNEITSKFEVIPLYQPLTFNKMANKYFNFKPTTQTKNTIKIKNKINYPLHDIEFKKNIDKINIFIFASDALRNSVIDKETTPNIERFKKESIVFKNHYSGGNATRFGIFSLMYGLNSTYWFSFLNANRGSVLFDVLKKLNYQIDIISSTNTNWPEFRKTCYTDIQNSIKDDFIGEPWEKDAQSTKYFLERVEHYDINRSIFSFLFLDSPHGYSFPKEYNKFNANAQNIEYLSVSKSDKDIKDTFARYKNAVYYNDKLFGDMINKLKKRGLYENSLIIFTSDHGQEFYEYGSFGHNSSFSKAQINSPLIIKFPKKLKSKIELPKKYPNILTSHNDILPSILKIIGVKNSSSDYSNGKNIFSKNFNREYVFTANWISNAIVTKDFTYIFSNLPNKMFKNETRENKRYTKLKNHKIDSKIVLDVINDNRKFLK